MYVHLYLATVGPYSRDSDLCDVQSEAKEKVYGLNIIVEHD